jgi:hypothetical protein
MDNGVEWKFQMWMICEPCWRGRVYAYMEQRKVTQSAADGLPEHAIIRTQNKIKKLFRQGSKNSDYRTVVTGYLP